jgi:hypothetical protein
MSTVYVPACAVKSALCCAAKKTAKNAADVLKGVCVEAVQDKVVVYGTDSCHLAEVVVKVRNDMAADEKLRLTVDRDSADTLVKMAGSSKYPLAFNVVEGSPVTVTCGTSGGTVTLPDGDPDRYPNARKLLDMPAPEGDKSDPCVQTALLENAVKAAKALKLKELEIQCAPERKPFHVRAEGGDYALNVLVMPINRSK